MQAAERVIVTVVGQDTFGIIAKVSTSLYEHRVKILDISQTVLGEYFTMIMIADIANCTVKFEELQGILKDLGGKIGVQINAQHEDIFKFMHRI